MAEGLPLNHVIHMSVKHVIKVFLLKKSLHFIKEDSFGLATPISESEILMRLSCYGQIADKK